MPPCRNASTSDSRLAAFGLTSQNLPTIVAEVVEQLPAPHAAGLARRGVRISVAQVLAVVLHALGRDPHDVDQLMVVAIDEIAIQVQHVGQAAGHAGAEVQAGAAEHR